MMMKPKFDQQPSTTAIGYLPGMGSSRTVLDLEDSSRTKNRGLGL